MFSPDLLQVHWRKSRRSGDTGNCVEIALLPAVTGIRDSKNPAGGHLAVPPTTFSGFLAGIKAGEFTRP